MMLIALVLLSAMDGWGIAQWALNIILSIALVWLARQNQKIDSLGAQLDEANKKRIQEKFETLTKEIGLHLTPILQRIDSVCERMKDGDESMKELNQRDQNVELKMMQQIGQLKDYIRDECASTKSVEDLQREVHTLNETVQRGFRAK